MPGPNANDRDAAINALAVQLTPEGRNALRLPNVIGVGSGRCGTTYLYGMMAGHKDFYVTPLKELNYFGIRQIPFTKNGWTLNDYKLCFASQGDQKYLAEITPIYLTNPNAIHQIAETLPDVCVIFTLRDPLQRFISHYEYHAKIHKFTDLNSYARVALEAYVPGYFSFNWSHPERAIALSVYAPGIAAALRVIRRQNILFLIFEDLVQNAQSWHVSLGTFFQTDFTSVVVRENLKNRREARARDELDPVYLAKLREIFDVDIAKTSRLVGRDLTKLWSPAP